MSHLVKHVVIDCQSYNEVPQFEDDQDKHTTSAMSRIEVPRLSSVKHSTDSVKPAHALSLHVTA